ncbi:tRNA threonylcarbamoyladenosine dehydratase [Acidovorax sp. JG5]|uniref:tRNA threonylcarbamoyladenosine dehydratase n=1 Tax=Acidovorax sp. JG5 TaxID=2822718 RepID=UPI001B338413|nr:tRNA threonylcarbamoyladenosine dehydratase [Acidovorax sp. JG5]MBP3982072.1 tRNA threonylcarbamoyladenosine dehydratase [Acidovorax sp. JG5]
MTALIVPAAFAVVEGDAGFDADPQRRFGGLERLYGVAGAQRIRQSHVVVTGIGGVGSWAAEALARSGVGRITLIDLDHVAESNINRQIHALTTTVGQAKVVAMQERIGLINPHCKVLCIEDFVTPENWPSLLTEPVDAVVDACDQIKAKTAMAAWARDTGTLFVSVGAAGGKRHAHKIDIEDLSATTHDPLLAQLRYRLRKHHQAPREGRKMGVTCVFSREAVAAPDASCAVEGDGTLNCHGYGSVVAVTATFGQCAAGWVLDKLAAHTEKRDKITL